MKDTSKCRLAAVTVPLVLAIGSQALGAGAVADDTVISLNGTWHIQAAGGTEQEIAVPSFWDRAPGLRDVHETTYTREFDVPESFAGRRVLLRFDAVGDAADVSVNGQYAGGHAGACLPFEVDVTALVTIPSTGNKLAVAVRDDSHFSAPRPSKDRRNRKYWMPRGMGANNRKGLYQAVTLLGGMVTATFPSWAVTCAESCAWMVSLRPLNSSYVTLNSRWRTEVRMRTSPIFTTGRAIRVTAW